VVATTRSRLARASVFAGAASRYWLGVFPLVGRERRHWHERARQIPDPALRRLALITQRTERGNLEGAAAFAVLAPHDHRARVVRAVVAFQATYDYIDTLAEQPSADPVANGHQLHLALVTALDPDCDHPDYYEHAAGDRDDGYMRNLIDTCRSAFGALPSHASVAEAALRSARRMVAYQSLNHTPKADARATLARWATGLTPEGTGLSWWETAAGAASSLTVFALIAAAAQPILVAGEVASTESAYFPWIGALHVLLDSLIDRSADIEAGHHCLIDHYSSTEEAAARMSIIAARATRAAELLPKGIEHATILAAMTSFYLSAPAASTPGTVFVTRRVLEKMGALAPPAMAVLRARRAVERLLAHAGAGTRVSERAAPASDRPVVARESSIGLSTCSSTRASAIIAGRDLGLKREPRKVRRSSSLSSRQ
jgi:tetraprenyl-beta-curcumene synthase